MQEVVRLSDNELKIKALQLHERINRLGEYNMSDLELMNSIDCELEARGYSFCMTKDALLITK